MIQPKKRQASLNHSLLGPSHPRSAKGAIDEAEEHARALLELSIALIDSALDILEKHIKTDEQLRRASTLMPGGTVGKHFRHVVEMFQAFLLPLVQTDSADLISRSPEVIEINYDAPLPNSRRAVARSLPACRSAMRRVRQDLVQWEDKSRTGLEGDEGGIGPGRLAREMQRRVSLVAVTPTKQIMESSVGRELWFCSLHAIHHFSMLRTIAVHELGLSLPVEFGTAPSTLLYRSQDSKPTTKQNSQSPMVKSKL